MTKSGAIKHKIIWYNKRCEVSVEYSAPIEHPWPAKLNTCDAENEQCRRSSCTLTPPNLYDTINMLYSQGG